MGLTISHGCFRASASTFHWWRCQVAAAAGIDLEQMEGYMESPSAIPWASLQPDILHVLLMHPDWEGSIRWQDCRPLADRLAVLLDKLPQSDEPSLDARPLTRKFIRGLRLASTRKQE